MVRRASEIMFADRRVARPVTSMPSRAPLPPGELAVETRHDGEDVIVVVVGEFDLATAEPVREALMRAIPVARRRVVVDLSELTFIDSIGLHTILDAHKRCRDGRPTLVIRPGPPNVQRVFKLTGAVGYLPFESG